MLREFKEFATKGNVLDLAIGVVIGAAFGRIVEAIVSDLIMPPISLLLGNVNFNDRFLTLSGERFATLEEAVKGGAVTLNYGHFVGTLVQFLIVAFTIFLVVRQINRFRKGDEPAPQSKECPRCITPVAIAATRCPACTSEIG